MIFKLPGLFLLLPMTTYEMVMRICRGRSPSGHYSLLQSVMSVGQGHSARRIALPCRHSQPRMVGKRCEGLAIQDNATYATHVGFKTQHTATQHLLSSSITAESHIGRAAVHAVSKSRCHPIRTETFYFQPSFGRVHAWWSFARQDSARSDWAHCGGVVFRPASWFACSLLAVRGWAGQLPGGAAFSFFIVRLVDSSLFLGIRRQVPWELAEVAGCFSGQG